MALKMMYIIYIVNGCIKQKHTQGDTKDHSSKPEHLQFGLIFKWVIYPHNAEFDRFLISPHYGMICKVMYTTDVWFCYGLNRLHNSLLDLGSYMTASYSLRISSSSLLKRASNPFSHFEHKWKLLGRVMCRNFQDNTTSYLPFWNLIFS